jgi:hypothetical protein
MSKLICIHVCALTRHFGEQSYLRIRLETEAINLISIYLFKKVEDNLLLFPPPRRGRMEVRGRSS